MQPKGQRLGPASPPKATQAMAAPCRFREVQPALAVRFRQRLRAARLAALGDAEGYSGLLLAIEEICRYAANNPRARGLSDYSPAISQLAACASSPQPSFGLLLNSLREARNDAIHLGAAARRITQQAVAVATVLEDALAHQSQLKLVEHYMVEHPVSVDATETVGMVRQTMLREQFSALPYRVDGIWKLITDIAVVGFISHDRKRRLTMVVEDAVKEGLPLSEVRTVRIGVDVTALLEKASGLPVLVVDGSMLRA